MKRWLYIGGIALITTLLVVWLFLLFASDETKNDVFNQFGFTGETEEGFVEEVLDVIIPDFLQKQYLRQLTTKRIIGYTEVAAGSSTLVYFVEAGTGHVFSIDPMIEGSENRLSNITIPVAKKATVSDDGRFVAVKAGDSAMGTLTLITLSDTEPQSRSFDTPVRDFSITSDGVLLYSSENQSGLSLYTYDLETDVTSKIIDVPFRDTTIVWGESAKDTHYVYPRTSLSLEGYLYAITNGKLTRLPASGFGLSASAKEGVVLFSRQVQGAFASQLLYTNSTDELAVPFVPEKCVFGEMSLFCGEGGEAADKRFPDNWYRGEVSFKDDIWKTDMTTGQTTQVVSTETESQRYLDIVDLEAGIEDKLLYFINKNDQSLWVYEFPPQESLTQ